MSKKRKLLELPQCSICLDTMEDADSCFLTCRHQFHARCLCRWILENNSCPDCRQAVLRCQHVQQAEASQHGLLTDFICSHNSEIISTAFAGLLETVRKNSNEIQALQDELFLASQEVTFYIFY